MALISIVTLMQTLSRDERHGRSLEEEEEPLGPEARSWVVVTQFGVIITLSILFEVGQGALYAHFRGSEKHEYIKIFDALFKELTMLGFVGLCLMCLVKGGIMTDVAYLIAAAHAIPEEVHALGEEVKEETQRRLEADPVAKLLCEIFEEIHVLIFVIMICFIALVTILLVTAQATQKKFRISEHMTQEQVLDMAWDQTGVKRVWNKFHYVDTLLYRIIRREFYNPFDGHRHRLVTPSTFDFSEYLGRCMIEFVVELIEIPPGSFLVLLVVLLGTRRLMLTPSEQLPQVFAAGSWVLFFLLVIVVAKLHGIFFNCLPEASPSYTSPLPPRASRLIGTDTRPRFCRHKLQRANNPITSYFLGTSSPTKQEALFWFWSNGPRFLAVSVQLLLFLQAVFLAVFFRMGAYAALSHAPLIWTLSQWVPFFVGLFFLWPRILFYYTIATSTNLMKSHEHMEETIHHIEKEQFKRYEFLIMELNSHARVHMIKTLSNAMYQDWKAIQIKKFETTVNNSREIAAAFDLWDTDKSGRIDEGEMRACLKAQNNSDTRVDRIMDKWFHADIFRQDAQQHRRQNKKAMFFRRQATISTFEITKEDFCILMVNLKELEELSFDDENTDIWMKEVLDTDGGGTVSVDEFYDVLSNVCRDSCMDKKGIKKLFTIIDGSCLEDDGAVESVDIAKLVVWLQHFSATGQQERKTVAEHAPHKQSRAIILDNLELSASLLEDPPERDTVDTEPLLRDTHAKG